MNGGCCQFPYRAALQFPGFREVGSDRTPPFRRWPAWFAIGACLALSFASMRRLCSFALTTDNVEQSLHSILCMPSYGATFIQATHQILAVETRGPTGVIDLLR